MWYTHINNDRTEVKFIQHLIFKVPQLGYNSTCEKTSQCLNLTCGNSTGKLVCSCPTNYYWSGTGICGSYFVIKLKYEKYDEF